MLTRNANTCKKCFRVFCCKLHRKDHENRCCATGSTNVQMNPTTARGSAAQPAKETEFKKHGYPRQNMKRKIDHIDSLIFRRPIGVAIAFVHSRKILRAVRRKNHNGTLMMPSLPPVKEENEDVQEQPNKTTYEEDSAKAVSKKLGDPYSDFKKGSLLASPIALPSFSTSSTPADSNSTPLAQYDAVTPVEASATPLTFQVPRPPHKVELAGVFKTSTPKDNDEKPTTYKAGGVNVQQNSSLPSSRPHTTACLTDSIEESPINSEPQTEGPNAPVGNKGTFLINSVSPFIPATPITSEAPPVRPCNLMETTETSPADQVDDQRRPSATDVVPKVQPFVGRDASRLSLSASPFVTPFKSSKKKVSWSSDTYDSTTPYFSAQSHFSFCQTPVTPLQNPSLFTSVKDVFKNFVRRMPGTSEEESPVRKRLKLIAESKIKCRPSYKGRYSKSRSYVVFN